MSPMPGPSPTGVGPRAGTAAEWAASSLILRAGELGVESDTGVEKYGNGTDLWSALPAGSGVQVVRKRLGPYRVNYDDPGVVYNQATETGVPITPVLAAGVIIETLWLEPVVVWVSDTPEAEIQVRIQTAANYETYSTLLGVVTALGNSPPSDDLVALTLHNEGAPESFYRQLPVRLITACVLAIRLDEVAWTSGAADLYVLISEPA